MPRRRTAQPTKEWLAAADKAAASNEGLFVNIGGHSKQVLVTKDEWLASAGTPAERREKRKKAIGEYLARLVAASKRRRSE